MSMVLLGNFCVRKCFANELREADAVIYLATRVRVMKDDAAVLLAEFIKVKFTWRGTSCRTSAARWG